MHAYPLGHPELLPVSLGGLSSACHPLKGSRTVGHPELYASRSFTWPAHIFWTLSEVLAGTLRASQEDLSAWLPCLSVLRVHAVACSAVSGQQEQLRQCGLRQTSVQISALLLGDHVPVQVGLIL